MRRPEWRVRYQQAQHGIDQQQAAHRDDKAEQYRKLDDHGHRFAQGRMVPGAKFWATRMEKPWVKPWMPHSTSQLIQSAAPREASADIRRPGPR